MGTCVIDLVAWLLIKVVDRLVVVNEKAVKGAKKCTKIVHFPAIFIF